MKNLFLKIVVAFFALNSWLGVVASEQVPPLTYSCDCKNVDTLGYKRIRSFSTVSNVGDDGSYTIPLRLPFDFRLFSHKIESIYVNINGSVSDKMIGEYHTVDFNNYGLSDFMIAPYWADIHLGDLDPETDGNHKCGDIYYKYLVKEGNDTVGIKILWHEVGFFWHGCSCSDSVLKKTQKTTFELTMTNGDSSILPDGKNVSFCYKEIGFAIGSASGSTSGFAPPSSYVSDNKPGFLEKGTPATVGFVYKSDFYQVGQYDRPDSSEGNRNPDGTYYMNSDATIKYSGYATLLAESENCALAYDFRNKFSVNLSECHGDGMFEASIFAVLGNDAGNSGNYRLVFDKVKSYVPVGDKSYIRYDTSMVADGFPHTIELFKNNSLIESYDFVAPICCPVNGKITVDGMSVDESFSVCKDQLLRIGFQAGIPLVNPQYVWTFGNDTLNAGNESLDEIPNFSISNNGTLALQVTSDECVAGVNFAVNLNVDNCANKCNDCPSRFSPTPGEKYVVSGWVSAASQIGVKDSFEGVSIQLSFDLIGGGDPMVVECYPDGNIIDGWQRISKSFVIPQNAENMRIALKNESGDNDVYFDDIRFHPFNASVKGYVYDPKTLRLAAELDDENYATFYEYDEEGALVRIKKETERGVMTIREARQSKPKISGGN